MAPKTLNFSIPNKTADAKCHLMPCRIEYKDKTANVDAYFYPTIQNISTECDNKTDGTLKASFRGRPLDGKTLKFPDGFIGSLMPKTSNCAEKKTNELTYWNWDELPSRQDSIQKALDWLAISKALHES